MRKKIKNIYEKIISNFEIGKIRFFQISKSKWKKQK
jgi:hypothetical protein